MNFSTALPSLNILTERAIYFMGIKGVGMTSLAIILQQAGVTVSGCDTEEIFVTDELLAEHEISVDTFADAVVPSECKVVVYSGSHQGRNNPVVQQALQQGKTAISLAEAVGLLSTTKSTIAVSGVGGKSTTSALLAWIMESADQPVSFSVGVGDIPNLGTSGRWLPESQYFIVEADEYVADPTQDKTPRFLYLSPQHIICTSLSYDHPDVYESPEDTKQAFQTFFAKLGAESWLIINGDQPDLVQLAEETVSRDRTVTVGEKEENDVQLTDFSVQDGVGRLTLRSKISQLDGMTLESHVPGKHNLLNAAYAATLASKLGASSRAVTTAVASFRSTKRRFEWIGETTTGVLCYDDYAHHPREIQAIAQALEDWFPERKKVIAFQSHTFSRTKALYTDFITALAGAQADLVLLPIFASARESFDPSITAEMMVTDLAKQGKSVQYCPDESALLEYIQRLESGTVCITLGAGTIYKVYEHVAFQPTSEPFSQL